jgi:leucyl-tRNA synthetase
MLFQAPVGDVLLWDEAKIVGVTRWLDRLHTLVLETASLPPPSGWPSVEEYLRQRHGALASLRGEDLARWDADVAVWREVQRTIGSVTRSYEDIYSLNTVVSDLMMLTNALAGSRQASPLVRRETAGTLIRMAAPIAPAFAEECWSVLHLPRDGDDGNDGGSIFKQARFPTPDGTAALLQPRQQPCAVQVNGKVRGVVHIPPPPRDLEGDGLRAWMVTEILKTEDGAARFGSGRQYDLATARRVVVVKGGRVISFVL